MIHSFSLMKVTIVNEFSSGIICSQYIWQDALCGFMRSYVQASCLVPLSSPVIPGVLVYFLSTGKKNRKCWLNVWLLKDFWFFVYTKSHLSDFFREKIAKKKKSFRLMFLVLSTDIFINLIILMEMFLNYSIYLIVLIDSIFQKWNEILIIVITMKITMIPYNLCGILQFSVFLLVLLLHYAVVHSATKEYSYPYRPES